MHRVRISLRTYLIACVVGGLALAAYFDHWREPHRRVKWINMPQPANFGTIQVVSRDWRGNDKALCVVFRSLATNAIHRADLVGVKPDGIVAAGVRIPHSLEGHFWVIDPSSRGKVFFRIDLGTYEGQEFFPEMLQNEAFLSNSMWENRIAPVLAFLDMRYQIITGTLGYNELAAAERDGILGSDYGCHQGDVLSADNLPDLNDVRRRVDEIAAEREERLLGGLRRNKPRD